MGKIAKSYFLSAVALGSIVALTCVSAYGASAATRYVLEGSYIDAGYYGSGGLFVPRNIDTAIGKPLIVNCPGSSGTCVIEADLFIQSGHSHITGNQYSLCLFVDGTSAPNCQIVGSTPSDYTYANGSTSQLVTGVAPGSHTVQAFFRTYQGAAVFNYTSNYRVYK
jgi:hypothetical protein